MQSMKSSGLKRGIQQSNLGSGKKENSKKTLEDLEKLDEISEIKPMDDVSAVMQNKAEQIEGEEENDSMDWNNFD